MEMARSTNAVKYNPQWTALLQYFDKRYHTPGADGLPDRVKMPCNDYKHAKSLQLEFNCFLKAVRETAKLTSGVDTMQRSIYSKLTATAMSMKAQVLCSGRDFWLEKLKETGKLVDADKKAAEVAKVKEKLGTLKSQLEIYDCRETSEGEIVEGFTGILAGLGNQLLQHEMDNRTEEEKDEAEALINALGDGKKVSGHNNGLELKQVLSEEELAAGVDLSLLED